MPSVVLRPLFFLFADVVPGIEIGYTQEEDPQDNKTDNLINYGQPSQVYKNYPAKGYGKNDKTSQTESLIFEQEPYAKKRSSHYPQPHGYPDARDVAKNRQDH